MKGKKTKYKQAHTDNTKYGMGDYYGTGLNAKIGKIREGGVDIMNLSRKQLKTPPKNLA
jgi:hypothetical protein